MHHLVDEVGKVDHTCGFTQALVAASKDRQDLILVALINERGEVSEGLLHELWINRWESIIFLELHELKQQTLMIEALLFKITTTLHL